jgi:hypothetical protein
MNATTSHTIDEILHSLVVLGISAAAIFVKNPNSQQHAASIINLTNSVVLPLADAFLNPPAQAPAPTDPAKN